MSAQRVWLVSTLVAAHLAAQDQATGIPRLDEARFAELQRQLTPDPRAPWRTIPWQTSLLRAQRLAAAQDKPMFIWAMDGHPLGCT